MVKIGHYHCVVYKKIKQLRAHIPAAHIVPEKKSVFVEK
jgi:hypothetical protein